MSIGVYLLLGVYIEIICLILSIDSYQDKGYLLTVNIEQ
jgi:hypothetical protein